MISVSRLIVRHAHQLAHEIKAQAVLVSADAVVGDEELQHLLRTVDYRTILVTRLPRDTPPFPCEDCVQVSVPNVHLTRAGLVKSALLSCLAQGILKRGDRVVCLTGLDGSHSMDALAVLDLGTEPEVLSMAGGFPLQKGVRFEVFERAFALATQLAVEGREGRPVGLIFVLGDSDQVLAQSRPLVLNPFRGYSEADRNILDPALEETIKEYSALDGAFVIQGDGVLLSAGVQLIPQEQGFPLPKGLGTRHAAAAGITASTKAMAIVISQSTGTLILFQGGRIVTEIPRAPNGTRLIL